MVSRVSVLLDFSGMVLFHLRGKSLQLLFWQRQLLQESFVFRHIGVSSSQSSVLQTLLEPGKTSVLFLLDSRSRYQNNYNSILEFI